jgi:polysaccharide pyruvyl transferase WcaK-like protein
MFVSLYDTSVGSPNLGDQIIMESVTKEIENLFPDAFIHRMPTHDHIGKYSRRMLAKSDLVFAGGTNLLFSQWFKMRQWRMRWRDLAAIDNKLVLMGTGWATYLDKPNYIARLAYSKMLSTKFSHSVRDNYSLDHLQSIGTENVQNTGCPTLWGLMDLKNGEISNQKGKSVVTTLTDYRPSPEQDRAFLNLLKENYDNVALWIQGSLDSSYFSILNIDGIKIINPSLSAFDAHLTANDDLDFIGTRLHAGIRALQKRRRALIIVVDNRAQEMGKDFGLPVVQRGDLEFTQRWIDGQVPMRLSLPVEEISQWRAQFKNAAA